MFDARATHKTGIYRYATSLLRALQRRVPSTDLLIYVLYIKGQKQEWDFCHPFAHPFHFNFVEVPDDYQFVRDSVWLRHWLVSEHIHLYYSAHYLVDPWCPVPFAYTIHDLIRLKHPNFSYTDESFRKKFGDHEFEHISQMLQKLSVCLPANAFDRITEPNAHDYTAKMMTKREFLRIFSWNDIIIYQREAQFHEWKDRAYAKRENMFTRSGSRCLGPFVTQMSSLS